MRLRRCAVVRGMMCDYCDGHYTESYREMLYRLDDERVEEYQDGTDY